MRNPEFRALYEDGQDLDRVIDSLVARRKNLGLAQEEVGRRMGPISQSRVAAIEREGSNPQVSTLQRYARTLGVRVRLVLDEEP